MHYTLFFKPYDVLPDFVDPDGQGRLTLAQFVDVSGIQVAGRLDRDSEGLMLLTNDGELAHRLTHPHFHLPKTYLVQIERIPEAAALQALRDGVRIKGALTAPAEVELLAVAPDLPPRAAPVCVPPAVPTTWLKLVLREGKKRQIRHMTAAVGHPTLRLVRVAIGPLTWHGLRPGQWRDLTAAELSDLRRALRLDVLPASKMESSVSQIK